MLKGRKQRPVRADKKGRMQEERHGTKHFASWTPTGIKAQKEKTEKAHLRRR